MRSAKNKLLPLGLFATAALLILLAQGAAGDPKDPADVKPFVPEGDAARYWPGWRGPTGVGYTTEKDLPLTWDGKSGKNLLWKVPLGGVGNSSPIVWGDRVF